MRTNRRRLLKADVVIVLPIVAAALFAAPRPEVATFLTERQSQTTADAEYDKAAALGAEGRLDEARAVFESAAHLDPKNSDIAAAVEMFRDLDAGRVSKEAVQRLFRGMQYTKDEKWTEAEVELGEALKLSPRYARAHDVLAQLHAYQGHYDRSIELLNRAVTLDPQFAQGFFDRGATYAEMNQPTRAIADYNRAIALRPTFMEAYRNRGSAYANMRKFDAAVADYTRAHELDPRTVEPLFLRGVVHAAMEDWDAAITDFSMTIERDPSYAVPYYNRGLMHQNKGNHKQAVADYEAFLKHVQVEDDPEVAPLVKSARERLAALKK